MVPGYRRSKVAGGGSDMDHSHAGESPRCADGGDGHDTAMNGAAAAPAAAGGGAAEMRSGVERGAGGRLHALALGERPLRSSGHGRAAYLAIRCATFFCWLWRAFVFSDEGACYVQRSPRPRGGVACCCI